MYLFLLSILPGVFILWWFYEQDKLQKEPLSVIWKLFFLSAVITIPLAIIFESIIDIFAVAGVVGIFVSAFVSAALVEESLKCWMVKKFAFKKPFFDEVYDGIVYAVTASLGFATLENLMYVMFAQTDAYSIAIMRAFFAVPGHALDGALLGYYLGLAKFAATKKEAHALTRKGLIIAILFHGLYDFFIMSGILSVLILPLLIIQGRYVLVAVRQAHTDKPNDKLSLDMKGLTAGLKFFDFVKFLIGMVFLLFSCVIILGFILMGFETGIWVEEGMVLALIFLFITGGIGYGLVRNVAKKKKKYRQSLETKPMASYEHEPIEHLKERA